MRYFHRLQLLQLRWHHELPYSCYNSNPSKNIIDFRYLSESLNYYSPSLQSNWDLLRVTKSHIFENILGGIKSSKSWSFQSSTDTTLAKGFPCNATNSVNILVSTKSLVSVFNPTHLLLTSSVIGPWDI